MEDFTDNVRANLVRRSALIVPADNDRFVRKAHLRGADCIILDLEDGVRSGRKPRARAQLGEAIEQASQGRSDVVVRVNSLPDAVGDLDVAVQPGVSGILVPKVADPEAIRTIDGLLSGLEADRKISDPLALSIAIETPAALFQVLELAQSSPRLSTMSFSTEDYTAALGVRPTDGGIERLWGNSMVVAAAAASGIQPQGFLGNVLNYEDLDGLQSMAERSFRFGFMGGSCIHPSQVPVLNRAFSPSAQEVEEAHKIIEMLSDGGERGALGLNGRMIDEATMRWAQWTAYRNQKIRKIDGISTGDESAD